MKRSKPMESLERNCHGVIHTLKVLLHPALRKETRNQFERMKLDGVNPADPAARRAWIRAHRKDLHPRQVQEPPALKVQRKPNIYHNSPCQCGSGKKYKKCCGRR